MSPDILLLFQFQKSFTTETELIPTIFYAAIMYSDDLQISAETHFGSWLEFTTLLLLWLFSPIFSQI